MKLAAKTDALKFADLDRMPGYSLGVGPIAHCLQWLDTLLKSPAVPWEPGQRDAAAQALADARELMLTRVLDVVVQAPAVPRLTDGHDAPGKGLGAILGASGTVATWPALSAGCGCACEPSGADGLTCPDPRTGVPLCPPEANAARLVAMDRAGEVEP